MTWIGFNRVKKTVLKKPQLTGCSQELIVVLILDKFPTAEESLHFDIIKLFNFEGNRNGEVELYLFKLCSSTPLFICYLRGGDFYSLFWDIWFVCMIVWSQWGYAYTDWFSWMNEAKAFIDTTTKKLSADFISHRRNRQQCGWNNAFDFCKA